MNLGIIGHKTRGEEVIKILEMLGGINRYDLMAICEDKFYYIDKYKDIENSYIGPDEIKGCFTYSSRVLVFPTKEMKDAFYENFEYSIEFCKELL